MSIEAYEQVFELGKLRSPPGVDVRASNAFAAEHGCAVLAWDETGEFEVLSCTDPDEARMIVSLFALKMIEYELYDISGAAARKL